MNITITIRGIDEKEAAKSQSVKNYVEEALTKLTDFLSKEQQPIYINIVVTVVHPHPNHEVEVRVAQPHHHFIAERKGPELYKVIDEVMDIAFEEATKFKQKQVDNRDKEGYKNKVEQRFIKTNSEEE